MAFSRRILLTFFSLDVCADIYNYASITFYGKSTITVKTDFGIRPSNLTLPCTCAYHTQLTLHLSLLSLTTALYLLANRLSLDISLASLSFILYFSKEREIDEL